MIFLWQFCLLFLRWWVLSWPWLSKWTLDALVHSSTVPIRYEDHEPWYLKITFWQRCPCLNWNSFSNEKLSMASFFCLKTKRTEVDVQSLEKKKYQLATLHHWECHQSIFKYPILGDLQLKSKMKRIHPHFMILRYFFQNRLDGLIKKFLNVFSSLQFIFCVKQVLVASSLIILLIFYFLLFDFNSLSLVCFQFALHQPFCWMKLALWKYFS